MVFPQQSDNGLLKENIMFYRQMNDNQRRVFIDTVQLYEALGAAIQKTRSYKGGMHWKKAKGREYLFRSLDRYGYGKSLGPRSQETEKILADFRLAKHQVKNRLSALQDRLKEQARFCKAAMIQRVPKPVFGILRVLDQHKVLGRNVIVIGTNAMYAYEAAAGVFFDSSMMSTKDMDILWDTRSKLTLVMNSDSQPDGLLGIIRKADRSFEAIRSGDFRAVNRDGYMVDLIKPLPKKFMKNESMRIGGANDLKAVEIRNLHWLISSPKFQQIVIGDDGMPTPMIVPDPRSFVLHKFWLSSQDDREPVKKQRDREQAMAGGKLVIEYLPQYRFEASELRMFPLEVVQKAIELFHRSL
jgi:hypothetical protein